MPPPTGLVINAGTTINAGVTLNGFTSGGAQAVTLTSGTSLGFDGTGDYVQVTGTKTDWALGDNWTIEWWEKLPDATTNTFRGVIGQNVSGDLDVWHNNSFINVSNAQIQFSEPAPGVWHHIAVQKDGTTVKAYIDGVSQTLNSNAAGASTFTNSSSLDLIIGDRTFDGASPISQNFVGQLANIRISKIHRYSATFTPPTTVVVDANTVLALDSSVGSSGMLDDVSPSNHTITNNGVALTSIGGGGPVTYTGWPLVYGQGVYLYSSTDLQVNDSTNAAALWAVYNTLTPGTPISFVISGTTYTTTIADPARGGGGMTAPYISIVAGHGASSGIVSSVIIG